jgi:predicted nucleic acid-binding protein
MNNTRLVIADALVAFANIEDANHARANAIRQYLAEQQIRIFYPTTALCEAVTVLQRKVIKPDLAAFLLEQAQVGRMRVLEVNQDTLQRAASFFTPYDSKQNTLFDAVIAATATELHADAIFSFDQWYRKIGLRVTDDLIAQSKETA